MASGAVAVAFGKKDPREREAALGGGRLIARKTVYRGRIAPLLPQARLRPPAHFPHARPAWVISNERRVPAEIRFGVRMSQDEPFDEFLSRWIADGFFCDGGFAGFGLTRQIDRRLRRSKVARERRGHCTLRRCIDRRCRFAPRSRDMPAFLKRGLLVMPHPRRLMRFPGAANLVMAGKRCRISRKRGEHGQGEETSQRPEALVHSVVPPANQPARTMRSHDPDG